MFYEFVLTVPANTSQQAAEELAVSLTHGVITHVEVEFPSGCAGLVHTHIRSGLHQVWPTNPEGALCSDGRAIIWNEYYEIFDPPYDLIIGGWNDDDSYQHEITFRFEVTLRELAEQGQGVTSFMGKVKLLLGIK